MATIYSLYLLDPCLVYDPLQGAEAIGTFFFQCQAYYQAHSPQPPKYAQRSTGRKSALFGQKYNL